MALAYAYCSDFEEEDDYFKYFMESNCLMGQLEYEIETPPHLNVKSSSMMNLVHDKSGIH